MKKKVLIIDDDEDFTYLVKLGLERSGEYRVIIESRALRGVSAATKFKPDLILLDVLMPEKDGFEVLKDLKKKIETASIPVVMLTAVGDKQAKLAATQLYSENYLVKPVDSKTLRAKIDEILKIRKITPLTENEIKTEKMRESKSKIMEEYGSKNIKILVIDDDKSNCQSMETFLTSRGFEVYLCWDATKAMPLFTTKKPDIVMLDLVMPKIDGMEILRRIKELKTKAKVIVMSDVDDPLVIKDLIGLGADDIIIRPFSLNQISATLIKHLSAIREGYKT